MQKALLVCINLTTILYVANLNGLDEHGLAFIETSALDGSNVQDAFTTLMKGSFLIDMFSHVKLRSNSSTNLRC